MTTQTSTWHGEPPVPSTQRATPGTIVGGRYQLRAAIGNGGMGTVWQAVDTVLRRDVAVKEVLLPPGMPPAERTAMYERTFREGRAAAALSHPSVVQVYDVVTENGRPWIVMELLQARSLSEIIISDGPLAGRAVAKIGIALLGALEVAHAGGVLHRDVKPANVLICADGRCVLTDFGVARMPSESNLTQPGMVLGSPHFISPERAIGAAFGPPSDLFSLGVTLYTAAEGRPPFDRGDPFETMRAIVEDQPAAPTRAGVLTPVLMGLLEKDPDKRWTVGEARKALRELTNGALTNRAATAPTDPQAVMSGPSTGTAPSSPSPTLPPPLPGPTPVSPAATAGAASPAPSYPASSYPASSYPASSYPASSYPASLYPAPSTVEPAEPGRLGGRAMLGPGESVADRLTSDTDADSRPATVDPASLDVTADAMSATPGAGRWIARGSVPTPAGAVSGGSGRLDQMRGTAGRTWTAVRRWPKAAQLGAVGVIAALVIVLIVVASLGNGPAPNSASHRPSATPTTGPAFPVQLFDNHRGVAVEVPQGWQKSTPKSGSYTDFLDSDGGVHKIRVNVEPAGNDSKEFLTVAEHGLERGSTCKAYQRIALTDLTLGGHPGAQLEYTCGGASPRHGIWAATVINAKAYEFFLTVPAPDFAASKPIYDEMVSSAKITPTS